MELTGAQIVMEALIEQGTDVIFGYPGGNAINIYDVLSEYQGKIRHILTSHEQGAAHAADGYARATGKVGVCLATSGPGATNLVTGIATAYLDSIPMVAITANVPRDLLGMDTFQEVDISGITVPITKHNYFVWNIDQLATTIRQAFEVASSGRPGPVLIDIPKDITAEKTNYRPVGHYIKRAFKRPKKEKLEQVVAELEKAKKPVIYFGGGIIAAEAEEALIAFATKAEIPMVASSRGLSAVPDDFPLFLGLVGMHGTPVANRAVNKSDLLIAIGARFSDRVTGKKSAFAKNAVKVQIDIDSSELGKNIPMNYEITGDAKEVLEELTELIHEQSHTEWVEALRAFGKETPMPGTTKDGVDIRRVLSEIKSLSGEDTIIVTDVGQHQMITAQHYKFSKPRTFISSLGLGTMGYGMGAAIGAQIGRPNNRVVLITGDGCFHMNMNELAVAVTEELPLVVIIMNNGVLGNVRQWQRLFYNGNYSATTLNRKTDYVKLAEAMGATGMRIITNEEIVPTLEAAFANGGPVVIDCVVDVDESVYPIIPPGGTTKDTIFAELEG